MSFEDAMWFRDRLAKERKAEYDELKRQAKRR